MDQPQRANAAQLAARNIKARPKGRRTGAVTPTTRTDQSVMFAPMPSEVAGQGGGLFGGSVHSTGTFDFSAPAGGISFPPPNFGSQPESSPEPSDHEGRFPGDDRGGKRQFGSSTNTQQRSSMFQPTKPFGQTQQPNPFASTPQPVQGGNIFSFGQTQQSAGSGINFNSGASNQAQSTPNIFSFGQTAQQPPLPSPSISFGSTTAEEKPGNNIFNFNSQQSSQTQPTTSLFNFGAPAQQEKPAASTPFSFGQTSGQPSTPAINFGSNQTAAAPTSNLFGTPQPSKPTPPSNLFGSSTVGKPATTSNIFANLNTPAVPAPSLFGNKEQTSAPTSVLFGGSSQQQAPTTSNLFGTSQAPATSSLFGEKKPESAPSNNLFGTLPGAIPASPKPAKISLFGEQKTQLSPAENSSAGLNKPVSTSTIFNNQNQQPSQTSNLFGGPVKEPTSANDLFGNLNKPVDTSMMQSKVNGDAVKAHGTSAPINSTSSFSKEPPPSNIFGQSNSILPSASQANAPINGSNSSPSFGPAQPSQNSLSNNIFSSMKPVEAPPTANKPPPSGMFPSLPQPPKKTRTMADVLKYSSAPGVSNPHRPKQIPKGKALANLAVKATLDITDDHLAEIVPEDFSPGDKQRFYAAFRIRELHRAMSGAFHSLQPNADGTILLVFYKEERRLILARLFSMLDALEPREGGGSHADDVVYTYEETPSEADGLKSSSAPQNKRRIDDEDQENENPSKRTKHVEPPTVAQGMTNGNSQTNENVVKSPVKSTLFGNSANPGPTQNLPPSLAPTPSSTKGKRKATEQITQTTEELSPLRREMKTPSLKGSSLGSSTSNMFRSILDSPSTASPVKTSPVKKVAALPEPSKEETPRFNPFGNLPVPKSPTKTTTASPATIQSNAFALKAAPSTTSPAQIQSGLFSSKAPSNPLPTQSGLFTPKAAPALQSSLFTQKDTSTGSAAQNPFAPKATTGATNPFAPKPSISTPGSSGSAEQKSTIKPPVFGSAPVNFLAQFGQAAAKSEEALMEKAKDEDMDSDDDEAEWEANWKEKRKAELKALDDAAKSKRATFVPGKGFTFGSAETTSADASKQAATTETAPKSTFTSSLLEPKPLFGSKPASQGSGTSVFSSLNVSRTSTPGLFGSNSGSVLDGHTPGKPVSFSNNIFGHLSDADSGKDNDADNESADEGSDIDADSENKDPTYEPSKDTGSPGTPSTPVEETGAGIASAKKSNLFSFGAAKFGASSGLHTASGTNSPGVGLFGRIAKESSPEDKENSGSTTPARSLFDRVSKDATGNPLRNISSEEKENTQPNTTSIFGQFGSSSNKPSAPADHTWKPDSPIRFGTAASNDAKSSAPAVSITPATPTKSGNNTGLFGSNTTNSNPAPFSNLFGNNNNPKPAPTTGSTPFSSLFGTSSANAIASGNVGFGFGAPSGGSSLFPSAAGSTTTSRATSPGGTTDGESGVDGDPDAEKHEQIDLTAGGPGEEDEAVVHEVRAKALKWSPESENNNQWETKGVGPLRVLKHKESGVSRILMRADPRGTIVLNKGILAQVNYEATGKTLKLLTAGEEGGKLETWILQVKTPEFAQKLAEILESNKASA